MDMVGRRHSKFPRAPRRLQVVVILAALWLTGCASPVPADVAAATSAPAPSPPAAAPIPGTDAAWVEWGNASIARAMSPAGAGCPTLAVDGRPLQMTLRAGAATPDARPSASDPGKAVVFPLDVCEAPLPATARDVRLGDRALPAPRAQARRIVVLGDTGCRIKGSESQACSDLNGWPFAQVAAAAAALRPDLVIHVGDYHYRETPCPADNRGCAGSPWGYGWDAWDADFFEPARPLLAVAPWVFVRGNHEECNRAGQGWFRLLAPEPWTTARSCDLAAGDDDANFTPPYAVPIDATTQLIVFDSAHAGNAPLDVTRPGDAAILKAYVAGMREVDRLAAPGLRSWFASHHPVLGFAPGAAPGDPALQRAMDEVNGSVYYPPGVQLALHGHVHLFQALAFDDGHPATLVAGNGGDNLDPTLPSPLPPGAGPAPGTHLSQATTSDAFGFLLLERTGNDDDGQWTVTALRRDGSEMTHCSLGPSGTLRCAPHGFVR